MDDGGRCLLDVIDDPQLLQSFLENTNGAIERLESGVNANVDNSSHKTLATIKPIDSTNTATKVTVIPSMTSLVSESKQTVDQLTYANNSQLLTLNKQTSGQLIFDEKQMLNMVSSSVGLIPFSALSSAGTVSMSIAQPALTTLTSTSPIGQITSTVPMRASGPSWPPTSFQIANPRGGGAMTVLPQQLLLQPGLQMGGGPGLQQLLLTAPRQGGAHTQHLGGGIQPGQLVQIIQTPSGPQILQTNPSAALQTIVSSGTTTKTSTTSSSSRSNKQILPKPPGSAVSTSNAVTTNTANKCGQQLTQQNTLKVINSLPQNMSQIPTSGSSAPTQQILIGPGGQPAGVLGPQGTILLNHMIPGLGSQPIFFQQNIGNVPNSVQLTLRPQSHGSPVVAMSNGLTGANIAGGDQNAGLINALTAQSANNMAKQTPSQSPQPQTFVIPNNSTSVSSASSGVVMTNAGRPTPNIIFTRPPSFGAPHQSTPTVPTGQQFLQLMTPNGPVLVALPTQTQLLSQQHMSNPTQPTHGIQLGNNMFPIGAQQLTNNLNTSLQASAHPALHALLTHNDNTNGQTVIQTSVPSVNTSNTVIFTSQPQIISRPQLQQQSKPSVNLAELLKEHGILPESSPPSSPTNNSMTDLNNGSVHSELIQTTPTSQQTVLMLPSGPNQPPNIVLTQNPIGSAAPPQLRLALGPDGSVILQPHNITTNAVQPQIQSQFISNSNNLKYSDPSKDSSGLGSSQPSPDSTTPSIDSASTTSTTNSSTSTTTTTSTAPTVIGQNTSALLDQLNTGPAVKVPDLVASLGLTNSSTTPMTTSEETKPMATPTTLIPLTVQSINKSLEQQKQTILTIPVQNGDSVVPNVSNGSSNAVIRIGSCDSIPTSLVLTPTTVFTSPPKTQTTDSLSAALPLNTTTTTNNNGVNETATTVIEQNGVPMIQVSPNNQEFLQRLETQLKSLSSLKSPTNIQKELLQELLSLKQKMNEARHMKNNTCEDQKVVLNTTSSINVSPQTQQLLQSSTATSAQSQPNQSQVEIQTQQTPQNVHLVNLLKQTPLQTSQQIRLVTSSASTSPANGTATIQVGNQLITFTTPAKQQIQNLKSIATNQSQQTVIKVFVVYILVKTYRLIILLLDTNSSLNSCYSPITRTDLNNYFNIRYHFDDN